MKDKSLIRKRYVNVRWTEEEYRLLEERCVTTRAPSISELIRETTLSGLKRVTNVSQTCHNFKEQKESNKENKENSNPPGNAPARPRDFDFYFHQITDDESLREMVEEFLNGEVRKGVDLARKTDLREHFWSWLPKYRNKLKANAARTGMLQDHNLAKQEREEKAKATDAHEEQIRREANTDEAREAAARVCAKFGKPWKRQVLS